MKKQLDIVSKYSIVILLFLFGLKGFSQTDKVYFIPDSLKEKTYKYLYKQHKVYGNLRDSIKEIFYAKIYLHKAKNEKDTLKIANGYTQMGTSYNNNISLSYYDSIITITKNKTFYSYPGFAYMVKGFTNFRLGNYEESIDNYLIANEHASMEKNSKQIYYINRGIASIKKIWGDYNEAIEIYKSILEESEEYDDDLSIIFDLYSCYAKANDLNNATVYIKEGIEKSLLKKDEYWYYFFVKNSGYISYRKENFNVALDSINKGAVYDEIPNEFLNTHYYKGQIFKKLKNKESALYHFKKADSIYNANPDDIVPEVRDVQEYFVKYYGKKKDGTNQLKYINRLLRVDSIMDSYKKNLNQTIEKEYNRPRLLAEKQTIIDSLEADKKESNYAIWGLIGLSILILILTARFYYLQNQYKTRFNTLIQDTTKENVLEKTEIKEELDGISEHTITSVLNQLKTFEDEVQFLDKTITLASLSKRFNTNSSYLSKIINHYNEKNFNSYITDLRINYCIEQLQANKGLRNYTIKAIAEEVGFKNSESFAKAFFKTTGIYPSYFLKQIEKQEKVT